MQTIIACWMRCEEIGLIRRGCATAEEWAMEGMAGTEGISDESVYLRFPPIVSLSVLTLCSLTLRTNELIHGNG
jgi:hypothetical protein